MTGPRLTLSHVNLGTPDVGRLLHFYANLLGWTVETESPEWAVVRPEDGGTGLAFQLETTYTPPVWPPRRGEQQMMLHLELAVTDLEGASAHALTCGSTLAGFQPQQDVRVHLDPDGHPFCLYVP